MHALQRLRSRYKSIVFSVVPLLLMVFVVATYLLSPVFGAELGNRSLSMASNEISTSTTYALNFNLSSSGTIGSIKLQFCSNDPFVDDPCTAPAGMDASQAVLSDQSGPTGFIINTATNANTIVISRPPAVAASGRASYTFTGVVNPTSPGSYFARIQTFASTDATGPNSDYGGIAFAITNQLAISALVPPYLLFCTGITISGLNCANAVGDYIDFGEFSMTRANTATSQMLVATNAEQGYAVSIGGTTLASGTNFIPALAASDVSRPGTAQFGFNLRANNAPSSGSDVIGPGVSQPYLNYNFANTYRFNPSDTVVTNPVPDDIRVFTSSYLVNVPTSQAPGIYVSTVTYVCLANF